MFGIFQWRFLGNHDWSENNSFIMSLLIEELREIHYILAFFPNFFQPIIDIFDKIITEITNCADNKDKKTNSKSSNNIFAFDKRTRVVR